MKKTHGRICGAILAVLLGLTAQGVDVRFSPVDSTRRPAVNRPFMLYLLDAPFALGTNQVTRDRLSLNTGATGVFVVSNLVAGSYRTELAGTYATTTNWYQFPETNVVVEASDYWSAPTNPAGASLAYSKAQADQRYYSTNTLFGGENVTLRRSGGLTYIDAAGGTNGGTVGALTNLDSRAVVLTNAANEFTGTLIGGASSADVAAALGDGATATNLTVFGNVSIGNTGGFYGRGSGLSELGAANITGVLPMGTVSTGLSAIAGPILTSNGIARSYSYNGAGLTNLNASQLTAGTVPAGRLPSASVMADGIASSNDVARAAQFPRVRSPEVEIMRSIMTYPINANTPALLSNVVAAITTNGLARVGFSTIDIVGNPGGPFQSRPFMATRDSGGNIVWTNTDNWNQAEPVMFPYFKSIGIKIQGYTEVGSGTTTVGSPSITEASALRDAAFFARWADSMQIDYGTDYHTLRTFMGEFDRLHTNAPAAVRILADVLGYGGTMGFGPAFTEFATCMGAGQDIVDGDGPAMWRNAMTNLDTCFRYNSWVPVLVADPERIPGFFYWDSFPPTNASQTNDIHAVTGFFAIMCQLSCRTPLAVWNPSDAVYGTLGAPLRNALLNPLLREIQYDRVANTKVYSNAITGGATEIYVKRLSKQPHHYSVALFNRSTNTTWSASCLFTNCNIPDGTWPVTDVMTWTETAKSARQSMVQTGITNAIYPMECRVFIVDTEPVSQNEARRFSLEQDLETMQLFNSCVWAAPLNGDLKTRIFPTTVGTVSGAAGSWSSDSILGRLGDRSYYQATLDDGIWVTYPNQWQDWSRNWDTKSNLTATVWLKSTNSSATQSFPFAVGPFADPCLFAFRLYQSGGNDIFDAILYSTNSFGVARMTAATSTNWLDGKWHLLGITYDGSNTRAWVDGASYAVNNAAATSGPLNGSTSWLVYAPGKYSGQMQWPMFFNRTFGTNEMGVLYNYFVGQ